MYFTGLPSLSVGLVASRRYADTFLLATCCCPCLQDFTKDERKQLALKSRTDIPKFGSAARQKVISDMHERMLELQQQAATSSSSRSPAKAADADLAAPVAPQTPAAAPLVRAPSTDVVPRDANGHDQDSSKCQQQDQAASGKAAAKPPQQRPKQQGAASSDLHNSSKDSNAQPPSAASPGGAAAVMQQQQPPAAVIQQLEQLQRAGIVAAGSRPGDLGDRGLTFLAVVLSVAIAAMLLKKVMTAVGGYRLYVDL